MSTSTTEFAFTPLGEIWVPRNTRQRREIVTDGLRDSIQRNGVLHPIIIIPEPGPEGQIYRLVAGERRWTAAQELGHQTIPTRQFASLSGVEAQIIELEENIKRQDLIWQDIVKATSRIHQLYCQGNPDQTAMETAEAIGMTRGTISIYLKVNEYLADERISSCGTVREAYNILSRRDQRRMGEALQDFLESDLPVAPVEAASTEGLIAPETMISRTVDGVPTVLVIAAGSDPAKTIIQESFLQWAPRYKGRKFSLIHCDFPYGVNLFNGPQGGAQAADGQAYDDSQDLFAKLLTCLLTHRDKFMSVSSHLMFWYSDKHRQMVMEAFRQMAPEISLWPYPLIWSKTDNAGVAQDVRRGPRHVYETCLLGTRGDRNIVQVVADWYGAPTDKRWHPSTKPEPMLRHFMKMLVDDHTELLDPTCGSASAIRAAESLGAKHCLGMDVDEQTVGLARTALRQARALRASSGGAVQ